MNDPLDNFIAWALVKINMDTAPRHLIAAWAPKEES